MSFYTEFDRKLKEMWEENMDIVRLAAINRDKWLLKKINNECEKCNVLNMEIILNSIKIDDFYAYKFARNPMKQNFAELFQLKFLEEHGKYGIEKLEARGIYAYYLIDGELESDLSRKPENSTKSIDFRHGADYYYAKYTKEEGGAQDNQYKDGEMFIKQANKYCEKYDDIRRFILLVDGEYYSEVKKERLRNHITKKDRVFVMSSEEAIKLL